MTTPDLPSAETPDAATSVATTDSGPSAAPGNPAPDQTERVMLRSAEEEGGRGRPGDRIVVGDTTGALTAAALDLAAEHPGARVWSWSASRAETAALAERFPAQLEAGRLVLPTDHDPQPLEEFAAGSGARLVLARLPKSLAALEDLARRVALLAAVGGREDLTLIAGGRVKHMTRSQNDVLATAFAEVRASRGLGKSRALLATGPRAGVAAPEPATGAVTVPVHGKRRELALRGIGGVFGGARADAGSLLLLETLDAALAAGEIEVRTAVDLGSGNGLLTAYLAAALSESTVLGSDDDADAVASTRATLADSGLERDTVRVSWDDSLSQEPTGTVEEGADLVLVNPPFHDGTVVDPTLVQGVLDAAARVLRPGGRLWFVHNSHLRYRPELEARFEGVRQRARDRRFTVLSAVARAARP
ncbi:class I SAM-dependent methyltransferase [Brachybacterium sp. AOP43-C2-M15]|uniref:class I SAM-dependent methyltransferase n=1 Tax=Brachybacterium sp. AOP43-C2-M15 TaxID=3457661 RepID=UPI00403367B3